MGDLANTEKAPKVSFWKGIKTEFHKITWLDKQSLFKQTIAVVSVSVVAGLLIAVLDIVIQYGVNLLTM